MIFFKWLWYQVAQKGQKGKARQILAWNFLQKGTRDYGITNRFI
jgi:hypothetical protein